MTPSDFDDARIVALMQAYLDADYRWERDGHWHALQIGAPAPELETAFPEGAAFGLLSAWNPYSVERPEHTNRLADESLNAALLASGAPFRPGFSSARNRTWREPSWLVVGMPMPDFDALARRFGQLATLYWERNEPVHLRMYRTQPGDVRPAFVDWAGERPSVL